jgi:hypothetical protein
MPSACRQLVPPNSSLSSSTSNQAAGTKTTNTAPQTTDHLTIKALPGGLFEVSCTWISMTATKSSANNTETIKDQTPVVDVDVVSSDSTTEPEAPAKGEGDAEPKTDAPADSKNGGSALEETNAPLICKALDKVINADKNKRSSVIEKLNTIECSEILHAYSVPAVKDAIVKRIGESESASLLDAVAVKVQVWAYEVNNSCRVESLDKDATGHGIYAAQAPMGGIGFEVGIVERKDDDGKTETNRSAFGMYFRGSTYEAHSFTEEQQRKGKELADLLMS